MTADLKRWAFQQIEAYFAGQPTKAKQIECNASGTLWEIELEDGSRERILDTGNFSPAAVIETLQQEGQACMTQAPDRSGRTCDKPLGHDGDHWTYGGNTKAWASEPKTKRLTAKVLRLGAPANELGDIFAPGSVLEGDNVPVTIGFGWPLEPVGKAKVGPDGVAEIELLRTVDLGPDRVFSIAYQPIETRQDGDVTIIEKLRLLHVALIQASQAVR